MAISEEKIRQISAEAKRILGERANPELVKKVVREVVRRLMQEASGQR